MTDEPIWMFYGFCSAAGNELVQDWFDSCDEELRDEIRDSLLYHEKLERHLWKRPGFDELGAEGISEFRFKVSSATWRIYGDYGPKRHQYTFLHGDEKKVKNDKAGKRVAKDRKKLLEQGKAFVHEFRWKEDPD